MSAQNKQIVVAFILLLGWILMIAAVPSYALFWRVDNEPGAKPIPELLWAAICFISSGGLVFITTNIYLLINKSKIVLIGWALCLAAALAACSLSPILLIFMV